MAECVGSEAVQFKDDQGSLVLGQTKRPMLRPRALPPSLFVNKGIEDERVAKGLISQNDTAAGAYWGFEFGELAQFKQGGKWDAQRIGGKFHLEFVEYATVSIGLYCSAAGISVSECLGIQNIYAGMFSRYKLNTDMDPTYKNLPILNVFNTKLGYILYQTRRIKAG